MAGAAFALCFVTGLVSHFLQYPPGWLVDHIPSRPSWGYRVTQGLHAASGIVATPLLLLLLLAKLCTVYPRLFEWTPLRSARHALERLSVAMLVAGAVFELATGLLNTIQWYPWPFSFDTGGCQRWICSITASICEPMGGKSASSSSWLLVVWENCWIMSIEADRPAFS